jgi:hypothetical protein
MEMMIRHATGKPALFFISTTVSGRVSRMVLGFIKAHNYSLYEYTNVEDMVKIVKSELEN